MAVPNRRLDPPAPPAAPRRYTIDPTTVSLTTALGVGWLVIAVIVAGWAGGGGVSRGFVGAAAAAAAGAAHLVIASRRKANGIEVAGHGFRAPTPEAAWLSWSAVRAIQVQRIRQRLVLRGDGGRALAVLSFRLGGFAQAVDDVVAACPDAVPDRPRPVTFRQPLLGRLAAGAAIVVLLGMLTGVAYTIGAAVGGAAGLAAGLAVALLAMLAIALQVRRDLGARPVAVTIDDDGITGRAGGRTWHVARADLRAVRLLVKRQVSTRGGDVFVLDVAAADHAHRTRSILPRWTDPLAVLATARPLVAPPGESPTPTPPPPSGSAPSARSDRPYRARRPRR